MPIWLNILFGIIAAVCAVVGIIISAINVKKNKDLNNKIQSINSKIEVKKTNQSIINFVEGNADTEINNFYVENLNNITLMAAKEKPLVDLQKKVNENRSWSLLFRENAKYIDATDIQKIWSKILCDDDYTSLGLLNCLFNITKESAKIFDEFLQHVVDIEECIIINNKNNKYSFKNLFLLKDLNLVDIGPFLQFYRELEPHKLTKFLMTEELICLVINEDEIKYTLRIDDIYRLTNLGKELVKYINHSNMNQREFLEIIKHIQSQNKKVKFYVHKILSYENDKVVFDNKVDLLQIK